MLNILYFGIVTFQRKCSASIMAIFYSSLMSYFPGMLRRHLQNDAPIITGIIFVFTFQVRSISVAKSLQALSFNLLLLC